jgi:menaquinone-dependent protoporphyrinogen IX oxidase
VSGAEVVVTAHPAFFDAAAFDAVVVAARVHGSRYPWHVMRFIRRNFRTLRSRPSAFLSVSLISGPSTARCAGASKDRLI